MFLSKQRAELLLHDLGMEVSDLDFPLSQFDKGFKNEKEEHQLDDYTTAKLVVDHLKETSDYYDRLELLECEEECNADDLKGKFKKANKSMKKEED